MPDDNPGDILPPYSNMILSLVARIREANSSEERANLMMNLAAQFTHEHDPTDEMLDEELHEYIEEYQQARMRFQQAAMLVGRLAMNEVQGYFAENNVPLPTVVKRDTMTN